jgi:hypothetical protein
MALRSGQFTPEELSTLELTPEEEEIARTAHASATAYRVHATAALNGDMSMFAESLRIAEATAESFRKKTQMSLMKLSDCTLTSLLLIPFSGALPFDSEFFFPAAMKDFTAQKDNETLKVKLEDLQVKQLFS